MASSKVVTSSTSKNPDRRRKSSNTKPSISDLHNNHAQIKIDVIGHNNLSTTVDGLLRNLYGGVNEATAVSTLLDAEITLHDAAGTVTPISDNEGNSSRGMPIIRRQESSNFSDVGRKTVQDILKEIVAGRTERKECKQEAPDEFMTLEDFLTKADAMEEEDVKIEPLPLASERLSGGIFTFDSLPMNADGAIRFGSGEVNGVRGKRRASFEPLDKASQQRQRRMIKNRESAARSRERKQAYQVELESLAVKLEEENEILLKEKDEQTRKRLKQLMEKIIPVVEKRKPARVLRRACSMEW